MIKIIMIKIMIKINDFFLVVDWDFSWHCLLQNINKIISGLLTVAVAFNYQFLINIPEETIIISVTLCRIFILIYNFLHFKIVSVWNAFSSI